MYNSSPTSADNIMYNVVNERIQVENHTECLLELSDVVEAVRTLRKGKHDGSLRFFSDHIIHGSLKLFAMLVMLINSIFIHGHSPDELPNSIVIPSPKNNRVSLKCSDNYRGIAYVNLLISYLLAAIRMYYKRLTFSLGLRRIIIQCYARLYSWKL